MAQTKKTQKKPSGSKTELGFDLEKIIPLKYQVPVFLAVILLIFLFYYYPLLFGGMTYQSGDIVTSSSFKAYVDQERDGYTLWYPYIFGGMPAYALAVEFKWFNFIYVGITALRSAYSALFSVEYAMWTFYLLVLAFTTFFLVKYLTKNNLIALFGGLAASFSTGIILFLLIGHVTKLTALCFIPLIFLMILKFRGKIKILDFAILVIALQLSIQGWHVQIIFYTLLAVAVYYIYNFIRLLLNKDKEEVKQLFRSAATVAGAYLIAVLIQADNLTQIYEYNPYSTRGSKSIVESAAGAQKQSESEFYQYATNWSFSPGEVLTFIIPSYYGFGNSKYKGPLTNNQEVEVNTYFGQMPFVDVAMYMGVIVFFLALFSLYANRKNPFVQFLGILSLFALLVSFGRTFPAVYDLMFYYFPFFDKFRIPSMILVLVQLSFPILAAMGLKKILDLKKEPDKKLSAILKYSFYSFAAVFVLSILLSSPLKEWFAGRVNDYAAGIQQSNRQLAQQYTALSEYIAEMFAGDVMFAFGALTITFGIIYGFIRAKISADLAVIAVILVSFIDLVRIGGRGAKMEEAGNFEAQLAKPDYVAVIQNDAGDQPFRMFNLKQDGSLGSVNQNSNFNASFLLQDFYGYSSIKPRSYQDYVDVVGLANFTLWRMMNVKYIITERPVESPDLMLIKQTAQSFIYKNVNALPRAFFVDSVETGDPMRILNMVKNNEFDPRSKAFVDEKNFNTDAPDSTAFVKFDYYKDEKIGITAKATGNNFLFLGDTYYPKGWKAYIDGNETPIYRVNHGFRGIVVPEGTHKIEFIYLPDSWVISKYLALILSGLTVIGLGFGIFLEKRKSAV